MTKKISRAVEKTLPFLKLTKAGKLYLSAFNDKVIYRAKDMFTREPHKNQDAPFSVFIAMCMHKTTDSDIRCAPDVTYWDEVAHMYEGDPTPEMTYEGERFNKAICDDEIRYITERKTNKYNGQGSNFKEYKTHTSKDSRVTFNKGVMYWKHGEWFKYPDQAIDADSRPCQPDPNWKPRTPINDPSRLLLDPIEELKKAIRSGKVNKKGLRYLRSTFLESKPELIPIIDAYLNDTASPDDTQSNLF